MPIQAGAIETRGLQLYGEIRLDLLSDLDRRLADDNDRPVWDVKILKATVIK